MGILAVPAPERPYALRYAFTGHGDVDAVGGTALSCRAGHCEHLDLDDDPTTFSSSAATVWLPPVARVVFAGLYWGGSLGLCARTAAPAPERADRVQLGLGGQEYLGVRAQAFDPGTPGRPYRAFADITRRFAMARGQVDVAVADVQVALGPGCTGGWALVLVHASADDAYRTVEIVDGVAGPITVDGFVTPASGAVDARVGLISYGRGHLLVNGRQVPSTSDVDMTPVPAGAVANGADSARLTAVGDIGAVVLSVRAQPLVEAATSVERVPGGPLGDGSDVAAGERLRYTTAVRNAGTLPAAGVMWTDVVPHGLTPVDGSLRVGTATGVHSGRTLSADLGELGAGASRTVVFEATVDADAASGLGVADRSEVTYRVGTARLTRSASATVVPNRADLALTVSSNVNEVAVDDEATVALTVVNEGEVAVGGVEVSTVLPAGLALLGATASEGTYSHGTGVWTVGTVAVGPADRPAPGGVATLTLAVRVDDAGPHDTVAQIVAADGFDRDSVPGVGGPAEDDAVTVVVVGTLPGVTGDLAVAASAPPAAQPGEQVTETVTVTNRGPGPSTQVVVTGILPEHAFVVSADGPGWWCAGGSRVSCTVSRLPVGATATLRVVVRVDPGATGSVASEISVASGVTDPSPADNQARVIVAVLPSPSEAGAGQTAGAVMGIGLLAAGGVLLAAIRTRRA